MDTQGPLLELRGISKSYAGVRVLNHVDFSLSRGEVHCLVGENGAGKSTLIKILSGAIQADEGEIILNGKRCRNTTPHQQIEQGISTIYQDSDLVDTLTVADNIFLGSEIKRFGVIARKEQERISREFVNSLNINIDPSILVSELSTAQKQILQMAKALKRKASVIIMDEPTSSLGEEESAALLQIVKRLSREGIGIIYISHYLEEVFSIADRITVLKDGVVTCVKKASDITSSEVIHAMVGRDASLFYSRERFPIGEVVLEVKNLTCPPYAKPVSFSLRKGEILGFGGLVGSGRSELMNALFGAVKPLAGEVYLHGNKLLISSPQDAIRQGICMINENRKDAGLFLQRSVMENVCIARNEKKLFIDISKDISSTDEMVQKLNLKTSGFQQEVQRLSGGNQQKSILARWLLTSFDVIIFDEPTKGVDIGAREEIYKTILELARDGKGIIIISSDMPELLSMSDTICVLREGSLIHTLSPEQLTEEELLKKYLDIA
ncbi:MAG: sugar ABC transporter ATP-binding protein [Clostridiales bacterium]|nr:sugar ABC transporter ATP-binding protein [Clostridiales bacterium]